MKRAVNLVKNAKGYPFDSIETGLHASGYRTTTDVLGADLLATWTPWRDNIADRVGRKFTSDWIVFENGYIPYINGEKYYSIGLGGYNGVGELLPRTRRQLPISLKRRKYRKDYILVLSQFGHRDTRYSMPLGWQDTIVKDIRRITDRPIEYRPKPNRPRTLATRAKNVATVSKGDIAAQIRNAHAVVTWNSPSLSVLAVLEGTPLYVMGDNCIVKSYAHTDLKTIDAPPRISREGFIHLISRSTFSTKEIESGIPFKVLEADDESRYLF